MRKGSKHKSEARQKTSESQKRRYEAQGGQTAETRQKISAAKRLHDAEIAYKVAIAEAFLASTLPANAPLQQLNLPL